MVTSQCGKGHSSPLVFRFWRSYTALMVPDGIWHSDLQENIHSDGQPPDVLHENQLNLHFDLQLLGFWVVVNIINSIARGDSICAGPTKSGPWRVSTVAGEHLQKWHVLYWMLFNIYWWGKNAMVLQENAWKDMKFPGKLSCVCILYGSRIFPLLATLILEHEASSSNILIIWTSSSSIIIF